MEKFNDITIIFGKNNSRIECNYTANEQMVVQLSDGNIIKWHFGSHAHDDYAYIEYKNDNITATIVSYDGEIVDDMFVGHYDAWEIEITNPRRCTLEDLLLEHLDLPVQFNKKSQDEPELYYKWEVDWDEIKAWEKERETKGDA